MNAEVTNCTVEELPLLKQFIAENYRPTYILLDDVFFSWFFREHPLNTPETITVKKISHSGNIVAMLGYQIHTMRLAGASVRGVTLCNLMVAPAYRSLGLGPMLLKSVTDEFALCLINGIKLGTEYLYTAQPGWSVLGDLTRHVLLLRHDRLQALLAPGRAVGEFPLPSLESNVLIGRFERLFTCDARIDALWRVVGKRYPMAVERSSAYLNWRYVQNPRAEYQLFALHIENDIVGLAVWRIETPEGLRIMRLVEFVVVSEYAKMLLAHCGTTATQQAIDLIDYFISNQEFDAVFHSFGFVSHRSLVDAVPMLFAPIDHDRKQIRCTAFCAPDITMSGIPFGDLNQWLITKGDGDQDRAT